MALRSFAFAEPRIIDSALCKSCKRPKSFESMVRQSCSALMRSFLFPLVHFAHADDLGRSAEFLVVAITLFPVDLVSLEQG